MKFLRRIGPDPHANGQSTPALENCPDIWELEDGDFAIIGIDMTDVAKSLLWLISIAVFSAANDSLNNWAAGLIFASCNSHVSPFGSSSMVWI